MDQVPGWILGLILSLVSGIVWLVRLEGRINAFEKQIDELKHRISSMEIKHDALDSKVVEQLASVRESLARIEGALGVKKGE